MKWWNTFYAQNKAIVWAAAISLIISAGIFLKVSDEVTRFTLIMPIFAGFILFSILMTSDEDLGDIPEEKEEAKEEMKEEKEEQIEKHHTPASKKQAKKKHKRA